MKRCIAVLLLLLSVAFPAYAKQAKAPPVRTEAMQVIWRNMETARQIQLRPSLKGRLLIPSVGIDVGLYYVDWYNGQGVADRRDSAGWYHRYLSKTSEVIADHSTQEFGRLPEVQAGDRAYLLTGKEIIVLTCTLVMDGHNTGERLTDADGRTVYDYADYLCYTCLNGWRNVRIVGFDIVPEGLEEMIRNRFEDGYLF